MIKMQDKLGKNLAVGDRVVFNPPSYKGLIFGNIMGFSPKMVKLEYKWQDSVRETHAFYSDVVKVEKPLIEPIV
jgi:hypothetical protein